MVLIGLGLTLITLSFLIYKGLSKTWQNHLGLGQSRKAQDTVEHSPPTMQSGLGKEPCRKRRFDRDDKTLSRSADAQMDFDDESAEPTPKATPQQESTSEVIPQLSLDDRKEEQSSQTKHVTRIHDAGRYRKAVPAPIDPKAPLPSTGSITLQSAPAAGVRKAQTPSSANLMPPPSVRPSALKSLPRLDGSLNPPPSAASSLRAPPRGVRTPQTAGLAPSTSTIPPSSRPSRKVVLDPGHSPLDWAHLIKNPPTSTFLRGDLVPQRLVKVTPSQVKYNHGRKGRDAWGTYQGKVYNLSPYLKFHPGGVGELMRGAGKVGEAERLFHEIHPWVNWDGLLGECLIGVLVSEGDPGVASETDLEATD